MKQQKSRIGRARAASLKRLKCCPKSLLLHSRLFFSDSLSASVNLPPKYPRPCSGAHLDAIR